MSHAATQPIPHATQQEGALARLAIGFTAWAEKWFPDAFVFVAIMQMAFVAIGGYVVATSAPAARLIRALAARPTTGVGAVGLVAAVSILASLLN
jgi:short-chain fatty acids transporter